MENLYSLFVTPPLEIQRTLEKVVADLSARHNAPLFEPHLTLAANIPIEKSAAVEKAKLLASQIKPFTVTLDEVSFSSTYFQNVFVRIKPTAELMNARIKINGLYGLENKLYMPHMSLLYGDHPMELREKITGEISLPKLSFIADRITVIQGVSDEPKDWAHVAEIKIGG